jgi:CHAT domain-containing protein
VAEKRAKESYLPTIHQVEVEVDNIEKVATSHGIQEVHSLRGSTTVSDTCAAMQAADIVHLACHGIQASGDALQSGFCLGDGRLTISKLVELKLDRAFLAFLSACETAKGDWVQPDQVIHLAAAMIFTGFKTVVATMWCVLSRY